jgi:hypothetical protein
LVAFLFAHGFVHLNVWGSTRMAAAQGTHPTQSWLLGDKRSVASALTVMAATLFGLAGVGLLLQAGWWGSVTVAAAGVSTLLVILYPGALLGAWIAAPIAINLGLVVGIVWFSWPSKAILGG